MTAKNEQAITPSNMQLLYEVARDLIETHNLDSALRRIGEAMQQVLQADGSFLLLRFEDVEYLAEFDRAGLVHVGAEGGPMHQLGRRFMGMETPMVIEDVVNDDRLSDLPLGGLPVHTVVMAPFPPERPLAVLGAYWSRRPETVQAQLAMLPYLSELASAAVANVNAARELQRLVTLRTQQLADVVRQHYEARRISETDPLTGLYNRRGFFERGEEELRRARKQGTSSMLFFCDVDGLKSVNDQLGHEAGDRLIQDCAEVLRESFRSSDIVARLGGDEFAIFANDPISADLIRKRLEYCINLFNKVSRRPYKVSMSTGVIQCQVGDTESLGDYLSMADQQMYREKLKAGRRRRAEVDV